MGRNTNETLTNDGHFTIEWDIQYRVPQPIKAHTLLMLLLHIVAHNLSLTLPVHADAPPRCF